MSATFDHKKIENKWQKYWQEKRMHDVSNVVSEKENFYCLVEFPYPSGNLHVGHWYAFAVTDIYARFKRMQGYNVLFPIGFDSFGLPAENAAIQRGLDPREWTDENISYMTEQLHSMGTMFDWSRALRTSDPSYYIWTQYIFTKFFEKGVAYKSTGTVNWCNSCKTVLADEQIVAGACDRCGGGVERREMDDWFLRITDYADRLLEDLESLEWPEPIREAQRQWIGRKEGAILTFSTTKGLDIEVFTTRPDTLFGATYIVLAPEHSHISDLLLYTSNKDEVEKYMTEALRKSDLERQTDKGKTGVRLNGVSAINPGTKQEIPIYIADYVLAGFGTGAIMAVPAHDARDWDFAHAHNLPIQEVITGGNVSSKAYEGEGKLINSGTFDGVESTQAREQITKYVGGTLTHTYRIRDWSIARQRYWGTPIPIVYDPDGKPHAIPEEHLPWLLPDDVDHTPDGTPPLARSKELQKRTEDVFGTGWRAETSTMDTFVDSSWYFLRYLDVQNDQEIVSQENLLSWMPVDFYSGGAEHTTVHLLYARFFYKAMHDCGLIETDIQEPFTQRLNRGLILGPDGEKMSKSRGNVIDPDEVVERLGSDAVRSYLAFIGPYNEPGSYPWNPDGIVGVRRFLERLYEVVKNHVQDSQSKEMETVLHQTIKKVGTDIERLKLNTAVSSLMVCVNTALKQGISHEGAKMLVLLTAPFAPHLAEELWEILGEKESVHIQEWPTYEKDKIYIMERGNDIAVQINGKTRAVITVPAGSTGKELEKLAQKHEVIQRWTEGKEIKRIVVVPDRLVNIVV